MILKYCIIFSVLLRQLLAKNLHVGIVGGGIGGAASAYYLRSFLKDKVDITVFESNSLGGRLATRKIGKHRYEVGGAIAIDRNMYISALIQELGLEKRGREPVSYSSLYDGQTAVFAENEWRALTVAQLLWRYGFGIYYLNSNIAQRLERFDRIYDLQKNLVGFENVTSLVEAMNPSFVDDLMTSAAKGFSQDGFSSNVIEDLVAATLRVNYGQHLQVHKFVGAVSVAGAGGGLWAVEGGNQRVPERLVQLSQAQVLLKPVTHIIRTSDGRITVKTPSRSDIPPEGVTTDYEFDMVVVAAPQTSDMAHKINFQGFYEEISFSGMYHRTVSTILRGNLRTDRFPGIHPYTDEILTTKPGSIFNSIGRIYPVDSQPPVNSSDVWKIFSQRPLTATELSELFENVEDVTEVDWLAYPEYSTQARVDKFLLSRGLYHVNAIEWAASAMEMSLIAAKNIAILVRNEWCSGRDCPAVAAPQSATNTPNTKSEL